MQQVYAYSITGYVKTGGTGLADSKVTAERVGEYKWTRTSSSGNIGSYTLTVDSTNSYNVAAMKTQYTRANATVNGGSTAPDLTLSTRSFAYVTFKIAYDTSPGSRLTIDQARYYLYSAEPWFREEHSIDFQEAGAGTGWSTDGTPQFCVNYFLDDLANDTGWLYGNYSGASILIGFTGKTFNDYPPTAGCISHIPTSGGTHPWIVISNNTPDMARLVMHEVSHAYGLEHIVQSCSNQIPNIMAPGCPSNIYIKNWTPSHDATMQSRRNWYN
ncbi:MAG: hypothetical protein QXE95_01955 [Candidatus Nitrosocaldus sp.]